MGSVCRKESWARDPIVLECFRPDVGITDRGARVVVAGHEVNRVLRPLNALIVGVLSGATTIMLYRMHDAVKPGAGGGGRMSSVIQTVAMLDDLRRVDGKAEAFIAGRIVHLMPAGHLKSRLAANLSQPR